MYLSIEKEKKNEHRRDKVKLEIRSPKYISYDIYPVRDASHYFT